MPSLPSTVVQGLLDGKYSDWTQVTVNGQAIPATPWSGTLADTGINICRRVKGSGTHAQFMKQFNRTGCQSGTQSMLGEPGDGFGNTVYENSDAGVLDNCLAAINDGTSYTNAQVFFNGTHTVPGTGGAGGHYGIGYQSTEKNASLALNTRFIKIDGNAPIALNAFNGNYSDMYFQSINHRANEYVGGGTNIRPANLTGSANTDAEKIATHFFATSPATTAVINTAFKFGTGASAWQGGYLQPTEAVAAGTAYSAANPITQWVRTTPDYSAPDSCSPLSYWQ